MPKVVVALSFVGTPPPAPSALVRGGDPRASIWQGTDDPSDFLVVLRFADEGEAQADLRRLVEFHQDPPADFNMPTDVRHVAVEHEQGRVLDETPIGSIMAVARFVAPPGYGHDLGERIEETLSTFVQLEGYCGHLQGSNEAIEEEAWAFVFATFLFQLPRPRNPEVSVRSYQRIA